MVVNLESQDAVIRRRLEVDERPLKKLARRVVNITRPLQALDHRLEKQAIEADFNSYEHTLRRLRLLSKANARDMERYDAEKQHVKEGYTNAEADLACLQNQLRFEQEARQDRASFDAIALDMQTSAPKSRKIQHSAISKLEQEVADLELENKNYNIVWQTRKAGFDDIMARLSNLQSEILGEKADAELRDAADSDEEEGAVSMDEGLSVLAAPVFSEDVHQMKLHSQAQGNKEQTVNTFTDAQRGEEDRDVMDTS